MTRKEMWKSLASSAENLRQEAWKLRKETGDLDAFTAFKLKIDNATDEFYNIVFSEERK